MSDNPYEPMPARVIATSMEAGGIRPVKKIQVAFINEEDKNNFKNVPGNCAILSMIGQGESMISITSPPTVKDYLEFAIMKVGIVTTALHELEVGDIVGVRGPYGNAFPIDEWKGKDIVIIGAGIGMAPIRSIYNYILHPDNRKDFGKVTLMYGARTPNDLSFKKELFEYEDQDDPDVFLCIDWKFGPDGMMDVDAEEGWPRINMKDAGATVIPEGQTRFTCFVPQLVEMIKPSPENTIAITCGPPIAIKFITQNLSKLGFDDEQIFTTMENRMKCGIGKCGRCNIGDVFVCVDGPVFNYKQVKELAPEY